MPNKMLIDASHPEETRVVVVRGNRIEEFDFESQDKKQLKGNIYLARVTRVEPSLQAAFVEYGGNRHGFLAFSEIHPDYYQIPVADRQALLRAEAEDAASDDDDDDAEERQERGRGRRRRRGGKPRNRDQEKQEASASDQEAAENGDDQTASANRADADSSDDARNPADNADGEVAKDAGPASIAAAADGEVVSEPAPASKSDASTDADNHDNDDNHDDHDDHDDHEDDNGVESVGAEDAIEEAQQRRRPPRRHYKIQEVIKRRQILLVQVVKEERGNKGAAITTYLSLAGRYSVLMPNTARGGGISRKITNAQDRKRLKEVVQDLDVPQGMGVILRTAGESRTKAEIKRDYEYLMRLWENVRNLTLHSTAPALVYEEGSLIKRSVRDLYNKDIDGILVAGEEGYREAKDFMRMLMPSHAKAVQPYRDTIPIFARNGIEAQLDRMIQPQMTLKSGGYIIINQTEALVAIDVNSGRSTKEHSIEDTALQTNLEAAEEVARQLRLRDLAGLIVIDFIDMEENRNNRMVEKRMKDCLKNDRARIQVGRISHFGLLEMSRQRIRASVLESTMKPCMHCGGTGHVRSDSSVALLVLRAIEEFLLKDSRHHITVRTPAATALYVLNNKRPMLVDLENHFGLTITLEADETVGAQHYAIFRGAEAEKSVAQADEQPAAAAFVADDEPEAEIAEDNKVEAREQPDNDRHHDENGDGNRDRKRRRRRRRRGGKDRDREQSAPGDATGPVGETPDAPAPGGADDESADEAEAAAAQDGERKKRRRGKRGGRRNRQEGEDATQPTRDDDAEAVEGDEAAAIKATGDATKTVETVEPVIIEEPAAEEALAKPKRAPRRSAKAKKTEADAANADADDARSEETAAPIKVEETGEASEAKPAKPRGTRRKPATKGAPAEPVVVSSTPNDENAASDEAKPKKAGWWQRKSFF